MQCGKRIILGQIVPRDDFSHRGTSDLEALSHLAAACYRSIELARDLDPLVLGGADAFERCATSRRELESGRKCRELPR